MREAALVAAALKVIEIRCVALYLLVLSGQQLGKLGVEGYLAGLGCLYEGQLVNEVGEPLALLLPADVCAPQGVLERLVAHVYLGGERLLIEEHQRSTQCQVLAHLVVQVQAHHCLALHAVVVVAFHTGVDTGAGVYQTLVDDGYAAHAVIYGVVGILCQRHSARSHYHRTLCYVGHSKVNLGCAVALVSSCDEEFVVFGNLFRHRLGAVVQFLKAVFVGQSIVLYPVAQMFAEGFCNGEEHAPLLYGEAFDKVKLAVGIGVALRVQPVQVHGAQQCGVLQRSLGQIGQIHSGGVALVLDVQAELLLLHVACP